MTYRVIDHVITCLRCLRTHESSFASERDRWKRSHTCAPARGAAITTLTPPPAWVDQAACAGADPEAWFAESAAAATREAAIAICRTCPVRLPCLTWAIEHGERGIWGATTAVERKGLRRDTRTPRPRQPIATHCVECDIPMVPSGQKPGPGERRHQGRGLCATCYSKMRRGVAS